MQYGLIYGRFGDIILMNMCKAFHTKAFFLTELVSFSDPQHEIFRYIMSSCDLFYYLSLLSSCPSSL